jgi:thioredoxin-related protein
MRSMIRLAMPLLFAALLMLAPAGARAGANATGHWRGWNDGLAEAGAKGKPVVVDVYTDWCGWCRRMDRDVYARDDVKTVLAERFVSVKLNAEAAEAATYQGREYTLRTLASGFRVTGYPTTVFLRANGDHIVNVPGYIPPERFLLLLRFIGDGHMDRGEDFIEFTKKHGAGPAAP